MAINRLCSVCEQNYVEPGNEFCSKCAWDALANLGDQIEKQTKKKGGTATSSMGVLFVVALFVFVIWGWFIANEDKSNGPCVSETRTIRNIQTIDGAVVGYTTEEVGGGVTADGYFIPRPDSW